MISAKVLGSELHFIEKQFLNFYYNGVFRGMARSIPYKKHP